MALKLPATQKVAPNLDARDEVECWLSCECRKTAAADQVGFCFSGLEDGIVLFGCHTSSRGVGTDAREILENFRDLPERRGWLF